MAIDGADNIFVFAIDTTDPNLASTIFKFTPDGTETTFAAVHDYARGLAFDSAGNLFVAEVGFIDNFGQRFPGDILKFAPNGTRTVFDSGIGNGNAGPEFLTFR